MTAHTKLLLIKFTDLTTEAICRLANGMKPDWYELLEVQEDLQHELENERIDAEN